MMDNCYGCSVRFGAGSYHNCDYIDCNEDASCPCTQCVVKPMCDVACNDFIKWKFTSSVDSQDI